MVQKGKNVRGNESVNGYKTDENNGKQLLILFGVSFVLVIKPVYQGT